MKKKIIKISIIICLVIMICIIAVLLISNNNNIFKVENPNAEALESDEFVKEIKSADANNIYYLLKFIDQEGIQKIIKPDGTEIYANNKTKVAIDLAANPSEDYEFTVVNANGEETIRKVEKIEYNGGILQVIKNEINESGITTAALRIKTKQKCYQEVGYRVDTIVHNGDLTLDGQTQVEGATLSGTTYSFGKVQDVGTASSYAQNTVVLKVNGNLTVNSGVTLTAYGTAYGGPKGMIIYVTGELINNGRISMTAKGAKTPGENVYLWMNNNYSYEYIPATGAAGGGSFSEGGWGKEKTIAGRNGNNGTNRGTGGGATGGLQVMKYDKVMTVRQGGNGTSYSGGTGSGAAVGRNGMASSRWMGDPVPGGYASNEGGVGGTRNSTSVFTCRYGVCWWRSW